MTADQLLVPDAPPQAASTVSDQESMTVNVVPLDESIFDHVSPVYWQWRELCERDPQSQVTQHPDFVLAKLQYASGLDRHPAILVTCESDFVATISDHLPQTRTDFLLVEDVETGNRLVDLRRGACNPLTKYRPAAPQKWHRIMMPATYDEYMSRFTSRTRGALRRTLRKCGEGRLERISEPVQLLAFLSAAHVFLRNSWQSYLLGLRVHGDDREIDCITRLVGLQALRGYLLWYDGNPVSFCIGTQFNGVFDYEEVTYDRQYAKSSAGHAPRSALYRSGLEDHSAGSLAAALASRLTNQGLSNVVS